jgi:hypothetical protein
MNAREQYASPILRKTLKRALRAAWDALGYVCAISLTLFVFLSLPLVTALKLGVSPAREWQIGGLVLALLLALALLPPLYAGACFLTHRILTSDEPSYLHLWSGFGRLYKRAALLGAAQMLGTLILLANTLFYLSRGSFFFLTLGVAFLYLLAFWWMNCLYHWPLLVAGEVGILKREDGGKPRLPAVFRNGFLLALSAPGFTFILLLIIMAVGIPLALSGVGMALLGGGLTAFLTTQATRDQLVRFDVLPPPPDPDMPVIDEGWKIQ